MRKPLTPGEVEEFRSVVCTAASDLFAERGVNGVTMRAIAEALGVSPMKPYHYFKNKDEILAEVLTRAFQRFSRLFDEAGSDGETAYERARAKRIFIVEFALREPQNYRLMFELPHPRQAEFPAMSDAMEHTRGALRKTVEDLAAEGLVTGDPDILATVFWGAIHGIVSLHLAGKLKPDTDPNQAIDTAIFGLFFSLAPKKDAPAR